MTEERKSRRLADDDLEEIHGRVEATADCMYPKSQIPEGELLQAVVDRADLLAEVFRLRSRSEDLAVRLFALASDSDIPMVPREFWDWMARHLRPATASSEEELFRLRAENAGLRAELAACPTDTRPDYQNEPEGAEQ